MVRSYLRDEWFTPTDEGLPVLDASTSEVVARWSEQPVDVPAMYDYARQVGGPALRALTFTERAAILKQLAGYLNDRRESSYYPLSLATGATLFDSRFDVDGGIGVLFAYSSRGRRELPDSTVYLDGPVEQLSKDGSFVAQHIYTPRHGLALFVNAFNFPVWGMLEKFAPAFLAGIPVVVKPAEQTGYLTEKVFADMVESQLLPPGAISLVCAATDGLLDNLTSQDMLAFTGSATTAEQLRKHPVVVARAVRFTAEADSLNCAVLGPDALPGEPEFDLFVKELGRELTVKAGQKCTAIRRAFVPAGQVEAVVQALDGRLGKVVVGDPRVEGTTMGALATLEQRTEFETNLAKLATVADIAIGGPDSAASKALPATGAFVAPTVLIAREPTAAPVHEVEAFGPLATIIGYTDADEVVRLAALGSGSLVGS
ncbi:MAG TPA: 3,4-dehydroadipyl-CoA semialdehyde dehydrogenase, partial [Jatrophihabitans sp.]|nr:3,4-dehydroadipyl-CoA semialdehyde dehydrogenase [Jatrophihabitans sp.]